MLFPEDEVIESEEKGFGEPEKETEETVTDEKESETDEAEEESSTSEEETEEEKDSSKVGKAVKETEETEDADKEDELPVKKDRQQKRIDKLTREKYQLQARIEALEKSQTIKKEVGYTDEQLDRAAIKAVKDNDLELLNEIQKERVKNSERKLLKMYQDEQEANKKARSVQSEEWTTILDQYSDDDDPKLDIRDQNSDLFRTAKAYYEDEELSSLYRGIGGMLRAVADAYRELTKIRKNKTSGNKKLERKLAKEKRKSSLGSGSSKGVEKVIKPTTTGDNVKDFIAERNAQKRKRLTVTS